MIVQYHDPSPIKQSAQYQFAASAHQGYYAVVPTQLLDDENSVIDEIISLAFDTLGASHLDVRVYDDAAANMLVESGR